MTILLLAEGFEEIEAVTPLDMLRRAGIEVLTIGIGSGKITGAHGISLEADMTIDEYNSVPENVIIPGGMPGASNISSNEKACELIKTVNKNKGLVAAICAAPAVVLAPLGILDGKKATCYPGYESHFNRTDFTEDRVVHDGNIITSRAAGTAAEFSLAIVEYIKGKEAADILKDRTLF